MKPAKSYSNQPLGVLQDRVDTFTDGKWQDEDGFVDDVYSTTLVCDISGADEYLGKMVKVDDKLRFVNALILPKGNIQGDPVTFWLMR